MTPSTAALRALLATASFETPLRFERGIEGPRIVDANGRELLHIRLGAALYDCDDEQDGCPEISREADAHMKALVALVNAAPAMLDEIDSTAVAWRVDEARADDAEARVAALTAALEKLVAAVDAYRAMAGNAPHPDGWRTAALALDAALAAARGT